MKIEFCPELQLDWSIIDISLENLSEIKITLVVINQEERPDIAGRHYKDILNWPNVYLEKNKTQFLFNECVYFNVRDDSTPGISEEDEGEGQTFQRLLKSELLTLHENREINKLIHYRIVTINEILDILSYEPPEIIKVN